MKGVVKRKWSVGEEFVIHILDGKTYRIFGEKTKDNGMVLYKVRLVKSPGSERHGNSHIRTQKWMEENALYSRTIKVDLGQFAKSVPVTVEDINEVLKGKKK